MRRFHSSREQMIMLRRWKEEMASHDYDWRNPPEVSCDPNAQGCGPSDTHICHCALGTGIMRKQTPHGCSRPRCGICHWEKFWEPKRRGAIKRAAIQFELDAE